MPDNDNGAPQGWCKLSLPHTDFGDGTPVEAGCYLMFTPRGTEVALVLDRQAHMLRVNHLEDALNIIGALTGIAANLARTDAEFTRLRSFLQELAPPAMEIPHA